MQTFIGNFPELYQFFAGYFPDADFDKLSDEEVVHQYKADCLKSDVGMFQIESALKELEQLIVQSGIYWKDVQSEANRHFDTAEDALIWLNQVKRNLES
jgi:hypothetical protein